MKRNYCLSLVLLALFGMSVPYAANASVNDVLSSQSTLQTKKITGKVIDATGEPVIGANVVEKGNTGNGTITDIDGNFTLSVPAKAELQISFIGYKTATVKVGNQSAITVTLEDDSNMLGEVEITAEFGLKRVARAVGSSVQNVKAQEIAESGRDNFISALQGRVSGMTVTSSSGAPGASTTVVLRSVTSISGSNQPLYVIDGVPMNNSTFSPQNGFANADSHTERDFDSSSRGNDLNPEDIESMTVLKGAAAAALYGSDASNGAIIITPKKGKAGKGSITYSNTFRWDMAYGIPELQTKYSMGRFGATDYYYTNRFGGLQHPDVPMYDNMGAVLQTGFTQRHNISVEGGTERASVRGSFSMMSQEGVIKTTDFDRTNISVAGKAEITKWLKFEGSMSYTGTGNNKTSRGLSGPFVRAFKWPVVDNMANYMDSDNSHMRYPEYYTDGDMLNPLYGLYKNKMYDESDRFLANMAFNISPIKNTFLRIGLGWDVGAQTFEASIHPYYTSYNHDVTSGGNYNISKVNFNDPNMNIVAGWNGEFVNKKLTVSAQLGYHQLENGSTSLAAYGTNYQVIDFHSINNCDPLTVTSKKKATTRRLQAISAQAELGWNNMAFLTLRARNDWSSTLPKENNSFFYPAAELAFVATELPFLKDNSIVSYLKIRGSVAQVGKDAKPLAIDPELEPTGMYGGGYKYGYTGPNKALVPEMTTSWEIGFEGRFLNDRIAADFTYFKTHCADQIVNGFRLSYATGFVLNNLNVGTFETWGWEAHIDGDIFNKNGFRWNVGLNLSQTDSEVVYLPENVTEYYNAYTWNSGGLRTGIMRGYPVTTITGQAYERNKDGQILISPTTGLPVTMSTWSVLGNREPKLRYGITTALSYKGLRLSAMFSGRAKATVVNHTKRDMMQRGASWESVHLRESGNVVFEGVLKDGLQNTENPTKNNIVVDMSNYPANQVYYGNDEDWLEKNVNYLRLQELRLSYNVPSKYLKKAFSGLISNANVYVCGNDLFTITNYSGIDAVGNTVSAAAGGTGGEGYDVWGLPNPRGISFGVSLTFN